jgi:hypothetical protein
MPITFADTDDLYVDKRDCAVCGNPTYRLGLESGDLARGEKEPLICNPCLITIRRDMHTEWELRGRVRSLETLLKVYTLAFSVVPRMEILGNLLCKGEVYSCITDSAG